ncbi:DsbA family protein [Antarcticirhabdus aurantiaca]|uniref:DsbA family protein n=1 Tax=Antarcticirhabdus aurantiaca TaxID=2606717 RepID=A0ACD4NSK0_9HYPH|nr:DsbA family protein [Antarcticirhabdus aurantiaca]WAJ29651.1 DsbA family protein [Jeongeuplla avenae]
MRDTITIAPTRRSSRVRVAALLGAAALSLAAPMGAQAQEAAPATAAPAAGAAPAVTPSASAPEAQGKVDVGALMAAGALPDVVIGDPNAPVTIVEYASTTCSHCADFHANSYPAIKAAYLDTGKAKLIIREFPFDERALAAFMLARCAGATEPERRTRMLDVLFDQQDNWARAENASVALLSIAKLAGLNEDGFKACLGDKTLQGNVVAVQQRAQTEFGVSATPTFFVNGDKYPGALSAEDMAAVIEAHGGQG